MVTLQRRSDALQAGDQSAPEPSAREETEEKTEQDQTYSEMPEEINEREEIDAEEFEELQSNPSGSLGASRES